MELKVNRYKTKIVNLTKKKNFNLLKFIYRKTRIIRGKLGGLGILLKLNTITDLQKNLKEIFKRYKSQSIIMIVDLLIPIMRIKINYLGM
jgi:hypothetical protein